MRTWVTAVALVGCGAAPEAERLAPEPSFEPGRVVLPTDGVAIALAAWGPVGRPDAAAPVGVVVAGSRAEYARPGLVEWWEPRPEGLEQGFTLADGVARGVIGLELRVEGALAEVDADRRSATLVTGHGPGLRYEGLAAWDERGRALPARMEPTADGLRLVVDTTEAVGAVTVDPVFPGSAGHGESNQVLAGLGWSVAGAGDVDGDGFDDLVAGAPGYDDGQSSEGAAFLGRGSAAGPRPGAWVATSNQAGAMLGASVASAGDVNGDGFADVVVGAPAYRDGQSGEGAAFVYLGSAAGLSAAAAWTGEPDDVGAAFGTSVASAGDVDGDGFDDLVVGAPGDDDGQAGEGLARLYPGSATGPSASPAWTAGGDQAGAGLGGAVASAGDVDGDGLADVVVGASAWDGALADEGEALVYLGAGAGLGSVPAWTAEGGQAGAAFGTSVASAGDVDGDGYADLLVGATGWDGAQVDGGAAALFLGSSAGPRRLPAWTAEGAADSLFGQSVAGAGDVNGDGYADAVVGAPRFGPAIYHEGAAYLYLGTPAGLQGSPAVTLTSGVASTYYGCSVASAGDVDGDGLDDVLVGALAYNGPETDEGAAILYLGR